MFFSPLQNESTFIIYQTNTKKLEFQQKREKLTKKQLKYYVNIYFFHPKVTTTVCIFVPKRQCLKRLELLKNK